MFFIQKAYCRVFQAAFKVAIPFLPYRNPKLVPSLNDVPNVLRRKNIESVIIITDPMIYQLGLTAPLEHKLDEAGVHTCIYYQTVPNPTIHNVEEARQMYLDNACQAIIAFGGGSSIDCAKVTGARVVKPHQSVSQMKGLLRIWKKLPTLIAVPTTAGTGSETTLAAVITDSEKHHKYPINDFALIPHYAVLDYRVTLGLPKPITATTGMDALTHAVEAYIGRSTTRETRAMAEEAVAMIHQHLKSAYDDGTNEDSRNAMLRAAYCAGIAFTKSYVGYVHAVAHSLGGQYGTPHGLANAVLLPIVLRMYGSACHERLAILARRSGVVQWGLDDATTALQFIEWIEWMNEQMGIPKTLSDIRKADIPAMAHHAAQEANPLYPVPVLWNRRELEKVYYAAMGDTLH